MVISFELFVGLFQAYVSRPANYSISPRASALLHEDYGLYGDQLRFDSSKFTYEYNEDYKPSTEVAGQSYRPKFSASFKADPSGGYTVIDAVNNVSVSFVPKFDTAAPTKQSSRLVYPIRGTSAQKVLTLGASAVKEDIILNKFEKDTMAFSYDIELGSGLEARLDAGGGIGIYGVNSALLGNVSTGTEKDAALLRKAREGGKKDNLLFGIPAPFIVQTNKQESLAKTWYTLDGKTMTVHASGLSKASFPLSIDPSVVITTATDFMRGNNETNVDFDVSNELIQKGKTTGAWFNSWNSTLNMNNARWNGGTAVAGGYVYSVGGVTGASRPRITDSQETLDNSDGTSFVMNMPATRPAGDLYIAMMCHDGSQGQGAQGGTAGNDISGPSGGGWTEYADLQGHAAYWKIGTDQGGGNESASYTWTGVDSETWAGVIVRVSGAHASTPVAVTPTVTFSTTSVTPTFPTITPTSDANLVIRSVGVDADTPSPTAWVPSGHTKIGSGISGGTPCGYVAASLNIPPVSGVATGSATMADASMSDDYGSSSITIVPAAVSTTTLDTVEWAKFNTGGSTITTTNPGNGTCANWCTNASYNLPDERAAFSLVAYNGFLYAIGGVDSGGTRQTTVYISKLGANGEPSLWHPTGGTPVYWYQDTTLGTAKSYAAAAAYNNTLYLLGGSTVASANGIDVVEKADIKPTGALGTWTTSGTTVLPSARFGHSVQIYNDYMYLIGGNSGGTLQNSVSYIKLNSDGTMASAWNTTNTFANARMSMGGTMTTVWGAYIYLSGGCTALSSGYCSTVASDTQIASINADGSLDTWSTISNVSNTSMGHGLVAWRSNLYTIGGCILQNTSTGDCRSHISLPVYGSINQDGNIGLGTVTTAPSSGTCTGGSPTNCNFPSSAVGNMLNGVVLLNGYLYILAGCSNNACTTYSSGAVYTAIASDGTITRPASCGGWTYTDSYCVNSASLPTALGAPGVTVFGGRIYIVGGFPSIANITYALPNADGSISGWSSTDTTSIGATDVAYPFVYARANPGSAGSTPGNLYIFGGCTSATGVSCGSYTGNVYKCDLSTAGVPSGCTSTGQTDIGTITGASGAGLGAMAGTVYANYIYLMGGLAPGVTDSATVRYAKFDNSNNVVDADGETVTDDAWIESGNQVSVGRRRGNAFGYNGYLYMVGGYNGATTTVLDDIEFAKIDVSDGSIGAFTMTSVNVGPRWGQTIAVTNGKAYVIGGCSSGTSPSGCGTRLNSISPFILYNNDYGGSASYSAGANLFSTDRIGAASTIYNGYLYVVGGCTGTTECATVGNSVEYTSIDSNTGALNTWTTSGNTLPASVAWGKLFAAGGTLYYVGGQTAAANTSAVSTVYYTSSISSGNPTWNGSAASGGVGDTSGQAAQPRTKFGAAIWNNRIYVVGGYSSGGTVQSTVYYTPSLSGGGNIAADSWVSTTAFNVARAGATVAAYANNLYLLGGDDGTNYLNDTQYTQINSDATVDSWTYSTSLPSAISQGDGFVVNGYIYLFGGRSDATTCTNKTLIAPISANTTIASGNNPTGVGQWFETNERFSGARYGLGANYYNGKTYLTGGACNSFPGLSNPRVTTFNTDTTAHAVNMPSVVDANDLLLVLFTNDANTTITDPDGAGAWTQILTQTGGTQLRASVWAKVAAGSEDATTVDFVTSATDKAAAQVYRVPASEWSGAIGGVEAAAVDSGSVNNPDPPNLDPGAWATENTTWMTYIAGSTYTGVTTYPTNFTTNGVHSNPATTDNTSASVSSASYKSAASALDPGAFTMANTTNGVAITIAIRPASGDAISYTGANRVVQTALLSQPQLVKYSRMIDTDSDVDPNKYLANGLDNGIGASWNISYRSSTNAAAAWGQNTDAGAITLGTAGTYTPKDSGGSDTTVARYFYLVVNIDASKTFGYPEDVARGPTMTDLSLFFTADPSKRLRHGKTFTGGVLQPLDTPF